MGPAPARPTLRERLRPPRAEDLARTAQGDMVPAAKVGILLYGMAGILGVLGNLASLGADDLAVEPFVATGLALVIAVVLLVVYERLTVWGLHLALVAGTASVFAFLSSGISPKFWLATVSVGTTQKSPSGSAVVKKPSE